MCQSIYAGHNHILTGDTFWFRLNPRNFHPRYSQFLTSNSFKTIFPVSPFMTRLVSKDGKFYFASFCLYKKFVGRCLPTPTPTQKLKNEFSILSSQEIGSSLVSLELNFQALQSELKIMKIPEFNLAISFGPNEMTHIIWAMLYDMIHIHVSCHDLSK